MNLHVCACIHSKAGDFLIGTVIPVKRKGDFLRLDWCCKYARNIQYWITTYEISNNEGRCQTVEAIEETLYAINVLLS
jgi:hypothetical protein